MAARTYTKSRTGCKTCRRRKVKCDETRPICINCTRREIECLWGETPIDQHSFSYPRIHAGPSSFPPIFASTSLDLKGIELMHQYTTSTCFTICEDPVASDVWRLTIPRLAVMIENKLLLDSLLAVAALHLHTLNSTHPWATKYATAAVSYFNDALRAAEENGGHRGMDSGAHFSAQMFIAIYGFASSASVHIPTPWLTILRTSAAAFRSRLSGLQFSSVAGLIPWITAPLDLENLKM
ncbi:hypothetical protein BDZ89DRAFT_1169433 [Hymenopellis radicata]|nr:hypothetical protein BDZ89DRAFT_1169433 [Hymenopellis radicata]